MLYALRSHVEQFASRKLGEQQVMKELPAVPLNDRLHRLKLE
jgi:hypothetical protein